MASGPAPRRTGTRFLFDGEGRLRASLAGRRRTRRAGGTDRSARRTGPSRRFTAAIAFLPHWPRIRLIVVGAGHVGQAVASLAAQADFDVWVVDDRHQYANRERFPTAQELLVGPIEEVLRNARDHPADLCPDRDARARPRPGSPSSACPDSRGLRRVDRQPPQDPAHFREPARSGCLGFRPRARGRAGRAGDRIADPCPRSRSASWPS